MTAFEEALEEEQAAWRRQKTDNGELQEAVGRLAPLAETSRDLIKQMDLLYKLACRVIETGETDRKARDSEVWASPGDYPGQQGRGRSPAGGGGTA